MQALVVRQLGMEGHGEHVALADRHRMSLDLSQHFHVLPVLLYPRSTNEYRTQGSVAQAVHVEVGLEALHLAPERVPARPHVEQPEVVAVEHDQAGAGSEHRGARAHEVAKRLGQALALDAERHRGGLAARDDQRVEAVEVLRRSHDARLRS